MTNERSFRGLLHWATHRIPGVPAHAERPAGHQGTAVQGRARWPGGGTPRPSRNDKWNSRSPRFMVAWQRRIAVFFGRELG